MTKMGLLNRRKGKTLLSETQIYERFNKWLENLDREMEELEYRSESATVNYQRELIKENRKKDFLRTFIVMCELTCQNIDAGKGRINLIDLIRDVMGHVIGDIIFETTDIIKLNEIMKDLEKTYLFNIDTGFEEELNNGIISEKIKNNLKTKGYPLSKNASIMKERGDKWMITDEKKILVTKEGEKLNIYKKSEEFMRWINNRRNGKVWILDTFMDQIIKNVISQNLKEKEIKEIPKKWGMKYGENAKYDFALFSGVSLSGVESMVACGISRTYLHNILYGSIMLRILMDALKGDLYLTWLGDEDLFIGRSGVKHFFDGIITLVEKEDRENPWLLKCISTYYNPLDAIESIDTKLADIGVKKCILFLPMYPSQNALRYSVYRYSQRKHEILILYIHDLYEMIGMDKSKIKDYLKDKRIK